MRNTAAEIYLEKGMNMEMGDIARKAGLGRGTVYHYYNNKISLIEDLLIEAFEEAQKITMETLNTNESPLIRLEQYAKCQLRSWIKQPFVFILFKNLFQSEPIPIQNYDELLNNFQTHLYSPVTQAIEEGIHSGQFVSIQSETLVKLFFGTLIGTATSYIGKNNDLDEADRPNWIDDVITVLFKGLKA
ncbi:TetR/AcrR family transcriptional regulator [Aneurinibacillus aneurinilyticus]|uniref:TetR/AcrR family transcriptional regulator n=2 Tax=Aneurinibacillus aneurinilyticus TaxID=1391 RepID=UPI0021CBEC73|nr:TetR/AcrR family transcriptional regulator [Aneurinibacillus aneurinilyticus]MED0706710.1 TetR/AcrR family transcriptional regulator [Aneurinibacillus aneurinilyticus]MED0722584.1 TetR/AcrR family transcriptional regulator [Aneurinibacillus aneurinilyticus]MED0734242.1 TetR/AcrR family transcriptional regulator [Aneurinibacillus aneurinilyticus]MED0742614.1 TetR/AcrR family transcriptional regulator [Aneurinibacillus aneurinilyticus]